MIRVTLQILRTLWMYQMRDYAVRGKTSTIIQILDRLSLTRSDIDYTDGYLSGLLGIDFLEDFETVFDLFVLPVLVLLRNEFKSEIYVVLEAEVSRGNRSPVTWDLHRLRVRQFLLEKDLEVLQHLLHQFLLRVCRCHVRRDI
jgi:hypothetical protein